jgi:hypothetical protein
MWLISDEPTAQSCLEFATWLSEVSENRNQFAPARRVSEAREVSPQRLQLMAARAFREPSDFV